MDNHGFRMLIGCVLPLLLIFMLPVFGISGSTLIFIFIILIFACHLFMMGGHGEHSGHSDGEGAKGTGHSGRNTQKEAKHGCH